jgi:hypothetical protein
MEHNILPPPPEERPGITSKFSMIASSPIHFISLYMPFNPFPNSIKSVGDIAALNQLVTIIFKPCYIYDNSLVLKEYCKNRECKEIFKKIGNWRLEMMQHTVSRQISGFIDSQYY